jgi:endogenous inhibitor of DNA gyrase (YacG/DUF329 family)
VTNWGNCRKNPRFCSKKCAHKSPLHKERAKNKQIHLSNLEAHYCFRCGKLIGRGSSFSSRKYCSQKCLNEVKDDTNQIADAIFKQWICGYDVSHELSRSDNTFSEGLLKGKRTYK